MEETPLVAEKSVKGIGYFQFIWTIFILTSAGPFGFEYVPFAVGVGNTLILIGVFGFCYAFPIALISSELSGLMPSRHGQIIWAYRAFHKVSTRVGDFVGFMNAANVLFFWILVTAILPIVFAQYMMTMTGELSWIVVYFIKLGLIFSGLILNLFDFAIIAHITTVLSIAVIIPFFIGFFWRLPDIDPSTQWMACSTNWPLAITTIIWEYAGFEGLGNIVNEISFNPKHLHSAYIIAILVDATALLIPTLTAATLPVDGDECSTWFDGFYAIGYGELATSLRYCIAVGSVVINWCIYVSAVGVISRQLWACAQPYFQVQSDGRLVVVNDDDDDDEESDELVSMDSMQKIAINIFPNRYIGELSEKGIPIHSVYVVSVLIAIINLYFGFDVLIEFNVFTYFIFFSIELTSYLILKHLEPTAPRLFTIPCGKIGAWLFASVAFVTISLCFLFMVIDDATYFGVAVAFNTALVAYYFIGKACCYRMYQADVIEKDEKIRDDPTYEDDIKLSDRDAYYEEEVHPLI